jgi:hypothetical protein
MSKGIHILQKNLRRSCATLQGRRAKRLAALKNIYAAPALRFGRNSALKRLAAPFYIISSAWISMYAARVA